MPRKDIDRREFLGLTVGGALSTRLPVGALAPRAARAAGKTPDLAVVRGPDPAELATAALEILGGMDRFVKRGDTVAVKPNIGWDRVPEQAANTNPEVVAALVRLCLEAGAKRVVVFDNPVNQAQRCYVQSGIKAAAEAAGADVRYLDDRRLSDMRIGGERLDSWPVYRETVEADCLINVPIAKHHSSSRLTMAMKNWLGAVGGHRWALHQGLDQSIVDLARFFKPTLTVLDAVRILVRHGPQGGSPQDVRRLDTLVAGVDQVAVDAYGAGFWGLGPLELDFVRLAHEQGVGRADLPNLAIREIEV